MVNGLPLKMLYKCKRTSCQIILLSDTFIKTGISCLAATLKFGRIIERLEDVDIKNNDRACPGTLTSCHLITKFKLGN